MGDHATTRFCNQPAFPGDQVSQNNNGDAFPTFKKEKVAEYVTKIMSEVNYLGHLLR